MTILNLRAKWYQNPEPDMKEYRLYRIDAERVLISTISHPTTEYLFNVEVTGNGRLIFVLTAVDTGGLESMESDPYGIDYGTPPEPPANEKPSQPTGFVVEVLVIPPLPPSTYIIETGNTHTVFPYPTGDLPAKGVPQTEPDFGTTFHVATALGDGPAPGFNQAYPLYSRSNMFNCDSSYFFVRTGREFAIYRRSDFSVLDLWYSNSGVPPWWDANDPNIIYALADPFMQWRNDYNLGPKVYKRNLVTDAYTDLSKNEVFFDFRTWMPTPPEKWSWGPVSDAQLQAEYELPIDDPARTIYALQVWREDYMDTSADGRYVTFVVSDVQGKKGGDGNYYRQGFPKYAVVFDMQTKTVIGSLTSPYIYRQADCIAGGQCKPNISISASGTYVSVRRSTWHYQYYDKTLTNVLVPYGWLYSESFNQHLDWAVDSNGDDVHVTSGPGKGQSYTHNYMFNCRTGVKTYIIRDNGKNYETPVVWHVSGHNYTKHGWALVSTAKCTGPTCPAGSKSLFNAEWADNQLYMLELNPNKGEWSEDWKAAYEDALAAGGQYNADTDIWTGPNPSSYISKHITMLTQPARVWRIGHTRNGPSYEPHATISVDGNYVASMCTWNGMVSGNGITLMWSLPKTWWEDLK